MLNLLYVYEERIPEDLRRLVRQRIPLNEFVLQEITYGEGEKLWKEKLSWADVVLFAPGRFLSDEVLRSAANVKLMQLWSSGYDKFNVASCTKYKIPVANNGGANACAVAEHAILLMLAVSKKLPTSHNRCVEGIWNGNHGMDMSLIYQKRIGIIGFGKIGQLVAKKIKGFEAQICYFDTRRASPEIEKEYGATFMELESLLTTSDIVTLHLHHNKATDKIIGTREINLMKTNSLLINVSRAQLVDQAALYEALRSKKLGGAGLDVFIKEPTEPGDPLLMLPNVVATSHTAGSTRETYEMVMGRVIENFRRVARGEKPFWLIGQE
ncbi:MAG: NAD(P)-dependent oxidoreductase [bacterium]|nr:NAD(P)-dependent oxidoreductase [bacterium]